MEFYSYKMESIEVGFVVIAVFVVLLVIALIAVLAWYAYENANAKTNETSSVVLLPSNEVPPNNSISRGTAIVKVLNSNVVNYVVDVEGFTPTVAHFHLGAPGTTGPVVKLLNQTSPTRYAGTWTITDLSQPLTQTDINNLLQGNMYINVHSAQYPDGQIRGQIF